MADEQLTDEQRAEQRRKERERSVRRHRSRIRRALTGEGVDPIDPVELENAAQCAARLEQVRALIDELDPADGLIARTQRGTTVHPYVGHERELRNELRLHLQALRGRSAPARPKKAAATSIADDLGPPSRALHAV